MIQGALRSATSGFSFISKTSGIICRNITSTLFQCNLNVQGRMFSSLITNSLSYIKSPNAISKTSGNLLLKPEVALTEQIRTVIKFSWKQATRKTVRAVPLRFYRLNWGIWIRTIAGRHKKVWKKNSKRKNRAMQHVFCNAVQSRMLDTMVSRYWRRPKYYIENPYEPYHKREEFYCTKKKPWRPEGCDYE